VAARASLLQDKGLLKRPLKLLICKLLTLHLELLNLEELFNLSGNIFDQIIFQLLRTKH
jgi:hypothetical protein